mgnify:FL=1
MNAVAKVNEDSEKVELKTAAAQPQAAAPVRAPAPRKRGRFLLMAA